MISGLIIAKACWCFVVDFAAVCLAFLQDRVCVVWLFYKNSAM